jgi:hypothetical protein
VNCIGPESSKVDSGGSASEAVALPSRRGPGRSGTSLMSFSSADPLPFKVETIGETILAREAVNTSWQSRSSIILTGSVVSSVRRKGFRQERRSSVRPEARWHCTRVKGKKKKGNIESF